MENPMNSGKGLTQISADSVLLRFILGTKYIRFLGKRMVSRYLVTVDDGTRLLLRTRGGDLSIAREVFESKEYEKYFRPQGGQTVIDVGAHIGCFTIRAAQTVGPEGKVLSFEPSSENFSFLCKNIALNGLHNVEAFNCALFGEDKTDAELYISKSSGSNSLFKRKGKGIEFTTPERVTLRTLDSVVKDAKLSRVDVLKIDAEGSELAILKGGEDTIRRFHPKITGEAHPSFSDSGQSILDYLNRFGYDGKIDGSAQTVELFNSWWSGRLP
jgi:FkbM family methyltransferase